MTKTLNEPTPELQAVAIWRTIARRRWWILLGGVGAAMAAWVAASFTPPQWTSTAIMQVGAVGEKQQLIEPVNTVTERIRSGSFKNAVVKALSAEPSDAALYNGSLAVRTIPATDLVRIEVRGYSAERAQQFALGTAEHLLNVHAQLAEPRIKEIARQLEQIETHIVQTETERQRMLRLLTAGKKEGIGSRFMESVMLTNIAIQQGNERRELERARAKYADLLSPLRTYPTKMIEPVWVSDKPVFPNTRLIVTLAALVGLFSGALLAFFFSSNQSRKGVLE